MAVFKLVLGALIALNVSTEVTASAKRLGLNEDPDIHRNTVRNSVYMLVNCRLLT